MIAEMLNITTDIVKWMQGSGGLEPATQIECGQGWCTDYGGKVFRIGVVLLREVVVAVDETIVVVFWGSSSKWPKNRTDGTSERMEYALV